MDSDTLEVTWLDGVDLAGAPQCEMRYGLPGPAQVQCPNQAVVRVRVTCKGCGDVHWRFYCQRCFDILKTGEPRCPWCSSRNPAWTGAS